MTILTSLKKLFIQQDLYSELYVMEADPISLLLFASYRCFQAKGLRCKQKKVLSNLQTDFSLHSM